MYVFAFRPNHPVLGIHFSALNTFYVPLILYTTLTSQPLLPAACDPKYINKSTTLNGSSSSLTLIRPTFAYLEHIITYYCLFHSLLVFLHIYTQQNSLTGLTSLLNGPLMLWQLQIKTGLPQTYLCSDLPVLALSQASFTSLSVHNIHHEITKPRFNQIEKVIHLFISTP